MENKCAIEMRNITKRFGQVVANDSINLKLYRGEILALLGENGSGKTTLMNMLSGIYQPDAGEIFKDEEQIYIHSPREAYEYGIGMIHQHYKLIEVFSATQNIILGSVHTGFKTYTLSNICVQGAIALAMNYLGANIVAEGAGKYWAFAVLIVVLAAVNKLLEKYCAQ